MSMWKLCGTSQTSLGWPIRFKRGYPISNCHIPATAVSEDEPNAHHSGKDVLEVGSVKVWWRTTSASKSLENWAVCVWRPFGGDLRPQCGVRPEFVQDVPQDLILKSSLPLEIRNEFFEPIYNNNSPSFKQPGLVPITALLSFSMTRIFFICRNLHGYGEPLRSWMKWEFTMGAHFGQSWALWMRAFPGLCISYCCSFFASGTIEVVDIM